MQKLLFFAAKRMDFEAFLHKNVGIYTHFGLFLSKKLLIKAGMMLNNLIIRCLLKGSVFGVNAMKRF